MDTPASEPKRTSHPIFAWLAIGIPAGLIVGFCLLVANGYQYMQDRRELPIAAEAPPVQELAHPSDAVWSAFRADPKYGYLLEPEGSLQLFNQFYQQSAKALPTAPYRLQLEDAARRLTNFNDATGPSTWDADVNAYIAAHCRILAGNNRDLFQRSVNAVAKPGMTNLQLLKAGFSLAAYSPEFDTQSPCPSQ